MVSERGLHPPSTPKARGDAAEALALAYLEAQGLVCVCRNYRLAGGPGAPGAEIDLILQDATGTLVFAEVRHRSRNSHGGAAASVGWSKRRRLIRAAEHYLLYQWPHGREWPPCRFDVLAMDENKINWLQGAFDASSK
jgi:putative endonuclease